MMKGRIVKGLILLSCLLISGGTLALADDLDDGISKYTDDGISKYDELGKAEKNINFIVLDAQSRAQVRANSGQAEGGATGNSKNANMNSVIMGPGGTVRGDIIIIDQSKGDKTQVVE